MTLRTFCPTFTEWYAYYALWHMASRRWKAGAEPIAKSRSVYRAQYPVLSMRKSHTDHPVLKDWSGQRLQCNRRVLGVHLVSAFHYVPWAHRLLNFWAGSGVWRLGDVGSPRNLAVEL